MNDPAIASSTFDKAKAVELGQLLQAVYGMYKEGDLEPAPSGIPAGFSFVAWGADAGFLARQLPV